MLSSSLSNTLTKFAASFRHRTVVQVFEIDQRSAHFKSLVMLALALALFGLSYVYGLNRGMDRVFAGPLDTRAQQVAAAISDVAYNLDLRYAVHRTILNALTKGGLTDIRENLEPLGLKYPDVIADAALWNNLLGGVTHLEGITPLPKVLDGTLTFIQMEDLGIVDFFKLSFRLFGYNVQGFFKTYFLLLGLGLAFLFAAFWSRPGILVAANFLLFGLFLSICRLDDIDSVANGRFFPTLAIFPTFHLALLIWAPPRMTALAVVTAVAQVLLLAFVITMRNSATWGVLLLGVSIMFLVIWKAKIFWSDQPLKTFVRKSLTWPIIVVAVGLIGFNSYQNNRIHPGYFALDETFPEHLIWHTLAYGLSFFPDIDSRVPGLNGVRGDSLPTYVGNAYLKKVMGFEVPSLSAYYASDFFPHLGKPRTYERVLRAAYFDFARQNPGKFLYFTFITKPSMLLEGLVEMFTHVMAKTGKYVFFSILLILAALWLARPSVTEESDLNFGTMVIGGMAVASSLPYIVAYPAYLGETFAIWMALLPALLLTTVWNPLQRHTRAIQSH